MALPELDERSKQAAAEKLQNYMQQELEVELGSFEAQFLLDFFAEHIAHHYYNKGLADALAAMDKKLEEVGELIYELEQTGPAA